MAEITQYHARRILDHIFGKTSYAMPSNLWVGLSSTTPAADGTGVTEPSTGAYARVSTAPADWHAATTAIPSHTHSEVTITFPTATADWVAGANLTHAVIYDAASGGNLLWYAAVAVASPVLSGDVARFIVDDMHISLG